MLNVKAIIRPGPGFKTTFLQYRLNKIELLEATNPDNPEAKFIAKKREGVHHVAFQVDDIRAKWNG